MNKFETTRTIFFGLIADASIGDRIDVSIFLEILSDKIDLRQYGTGLGAFHFTFICVTPDNTKHRPGTSYGRKTNYISLRRKVDYDTVMGMTQEETTRYLARVFIDEVKALPKHRVKDFDWDGFIGALEERLTAAGYLQNNHPSVSTSV